MKTLHLLVAMAIIACCSMSAQADNWGWYGHPMYGPSYSTYSYGYGPAYGYSYAPSSYYAPYGYSYAPAYNYAPSSYYAPYRAGINAGIGVGVYPGGVYSGTNATIRVGPMRFIY